MLPPGEISGILARIWAGLSDYMLKILLIGAIVSTIMGLKSDGGDAQGEGRGSKESGWLEGVSILLTFIMVSFIGAVYSKMCEEKF